MNPQLKSVLAILAGILAAMMVISGFEGVSHQVFLPPPNIDPMTPEGARYIAENAPFKALVLIPAGWIMGALTGSYVATLINRSAAKRHMLVFGILIIAASVFMLVSIPSPWWMWVLAIGGVFPAAWFGSRMPSQ